MIGCDDVDKMLSKMFKPPDDRLPLRADRRRRAERPLPALTHHSARDRRLRWQGQIGVLGLRGGNHFYRRFGNHFVVRMVIICLCYNIETGLFFLVFSYLNAHRRMRTSPKSLKCLADYGTVTAVLIFRC